MPEDDGGFMTFAEDEWLEPVEAPPPREFTEHDEWTWDWMTCPECRGWGFVKLSWYAGFEGTKEWLPCTRCRARRYVKVRRVDLRALVAYVPSWQQSEPPEWLTRNLLPVPTFARGEIPTRTGPDGGTVYPADFRCEDKRPLRKKDRHEIWLRLIEGETLCFAPGVRGLNRLQAMAAERNLELVVERSADGVKRCYLTPVPEPEPDSDD